MDADELSVTPVATPFDLESSSFSIFSQAENSEKESISVSSEIDSEEIVMEFFANGSPRVEVFMTRSQNAAYVRSVLHKYDVFPPTKKQQHIVKRELTTYIHSRDLRKLDLDFAEDADPFILVRKNVILARFIPLRAIILRDRCLLLLPQGADDTCLASVKGHLDTPSPDVNIRFELRALEAILDATCVYLGRRLGKLIPKSQVAMLGLNRMTSSALGAIRKVKNEIDELHSLLIATSSGMSRVLDDEEDLFMINLSKIHEDQKLLHISSLEREAVAADAEILLENYLMNIRQLASTSSRIQQRINNAESAFNLKIDRVRNVHLSFNAIMVIAGTCVGAGGLVPSIFGMNIVSNVLTVQGWFAAVILNTVFGTIFVLIIILTVLYRRGVFIF